LPYPKKVNHCQFFSKTKEVAVDIGIVPVRPSWKNQVRKPSEIKPGMLLYGVGKDYKYKILIVSKSYQDLIHGYGLRFKFVYWNGLDTRKEKFVQGCYCSDVGVVPYDKGGWNAHNRLIKRHLPRLPKFIVEKIISKMEFFD
jgi:hypothetical protein